MNDLTITYITNSIATTVSCLNYELGEYGNRNVDMITVFGEEIAKKTSLLKKYIAGDTLDIVEKIRLDAIITVATKENAYA